MGAGVGLFSDPGPRGISAGSGHRGDGGCNGSRDGSGKPQINNKCAPFSGDEQQCLNLHVLGLPNGQVAPEAQVIKPPINRQ